MSEYEKEQAEFWAEWEVFKARAEERWPGYVMFPPDFATYAQWRLARVLEEQLPAIERALPEHARTP